MKSVAAGLWTGLPGCGRLRARDVQVHHDRFLAAAYDDSLDRLIGPRVHLLMRDVRGDVDEIAGPGFFDVFEALTPTEAGAAADDVENGLELPMVVRRCAGGGFHGDGAGPQFARAGAGMSDGGGTGHPRSLRGVRVQLARADDPDA